MSLDATNIVSSAQELIANHNKREVVAMARGLGWRGDDARAPLLQIALYVATRVNSGEKGEKHEGEKRTPEAEKDSPFRPLEAEGKADSAEKPLEAPQGSDAGQDGESQSEAPQGQDEGQDAEGQSETPEGQDDAGQDEGQDQSMPESSGSQQSETEPEEPEANDSSAEFRSLLKASGIATPHYLLEKVWRLATKAKQNVLLVGPAAAGKTMLAEQLAQLMRLPFSSVSCTMGMSESQLSGWLLPVKAGGTFDYVPSPFIECIQTPSVFLTDEIDGSDPNVLLMLNSLLSNGFLTVPHKLGAPTIIRHEGSIIIAGANTSGGGADEQYSARAALDASTLDRFYPLAVDYDPAYEKSLFNLTRKAKQRSAPWEAGPVLTQDSADTLHDWFVTLRAQTRHKRINRLVSTRFAQRLVAAAKAGIPVEEIKADLRLGWTADELVRVGV